MLTVAFKRMIALCDQILSMCVVDITGGVVYCKLASRDLFNCQKCSQLFYFGLSQEARKLYSVQFGQLGRKLRPMEILIPGESTLVLKGAGGYRMELDLGWTHF